MANATVEKLKAFGLRHGEKIAVTLVSILCVVLFAKAFTHPTIEITPDDVKRAADSDKTNINKPATPDDIQRKLDQDGVKEVAFLEVVEKNKPGAKSAEPYRLANSFTAPEPGAGLIRETPVL